ncbi:MAG TPA: amidohydrolase family protein [Vicinamibacterales bacterium]|jgi:imidazolonepropionase-like amidohydrolase
MGGAKVWETPGMRAKEHARRFPSLTSVPVVAALVLAGAVGLAHETDGQARPWGPERVFRNARIIDGDGRVISSKGNLVVADGKIVSVGGSTVPATAESIDLAGRTIIPGLVNAHGHVADTQGLQTGAQFYTDANLTAQLKRYANYGVTTVMSLGGDGPAGFALRDRQEQPGLDRARIFVAGPVITAATPEAARKEVDRVAAMKPDLIKIRVDDNLGTTTKMPLEVARAVIEQAKTHNLRVAAHIFYLEDAKALVRAGAAFIAHSIRDLPVDAELIGLLKERNVCVCPTLTREVSTFVYESEPGFFKDPFFLKYADSAVLDALRDPKRQAQMKQSKSAQRYKAALEVAIANVKRLYDAGVPLASGTDTGPPARFQGYFEHLELELVARSGMPPAAILAMATGGAAQCSKLTNLGFLRPGHWADFVVLTGDPLADIKQTRTIDSVWIAGRRVER